MKIASQSSTSQSPLYTQTAHPAATDKQEPLNKHNGAAVAQTRTAGPGHAKGGKTSRPAWLKDVMFRDDTLVRTEHGPERIQNRHSSRRWADDQSGANRPADEFRLGIHRHLTHRWANDRSATLDQISNAIYAAARQQQLRAIPGAGYLAEQYGLQMAKDKTPLQIRPGLRIDNRFSSRYQRTKPNDGLRDQCLSIYRGLGHEHPADQLVFVNSEINASRILAMLTHYITTGLVGRGTWRRKPLSHGLVAIEFDSSLLAERAEKILVKLGGRPSSYGVGKIAYQAPTPVGPSSRLGEGIDNRKTLFEALSEDDKGSIAALKNLPAGHAMRVTANCAASLLEGLRKELIRKADTSPFQHDLLVANALNALANTIRALPAMTEDSTRFFAGYEAMLEELHLVLAAVKPYQESDFKQAAAAMLATRAGPSFAGLQSATSETYLFSNGMEAISVGIDIARMLSGTKNVRPLADQESSPDYYETLFLISPGDQDRIRIANLNPNLPGKEGIRDIVNNWDAEKLLRQTMAWLTAGGVRADDGPAVLVLDITIEKQNPEGMSDLATVLARLQPYINDGRLKIVLCRSYQKYTSLGSGKIMAGAVTLIARDDPGTRAAAARLREAEKNLGWMRNDESQSLTHFLTHAHASELEMIGAAANNAAFISRFCFDALHHSGRFKVFREIGLPFVVTNAGYQELAISTKRKRVIPHANRLLGRQVTYRDSFGFLSTSTVGTEDCKVRITVGQETWEELVEKLYGFAWLNRAGLEQFTPVDVAVEAKRIAADAMRFVLREHDVMSWAQAALQVLRSRASRGTGADAAAVDECEALLDEIAGMPTAWETHSGNGLEERKAVLRQQLETALNISEPLAESLLSDHLRMVGSAFAPRLAADALGKNDVDAMRAAIRRTHDGSLGEGRMPDDYLLARYAPNAVASLLAMAGLGFGPQEVDERFRQELESLYSAVLSAGLPGVSPVTRAQIVQDWSRLQNEKLHASGQESQRVVVNELVRHVRLSPYRETGAKILASIPKSTFARLQRPEQRQLIDALFAPLDVTSRLAFIKNLARDNEFDKLTACIERFGEDLKQLDEGRGNMLFPDDLSSPAESLVDEPRLVSASQPVEIARAFEAAQSASGILSDEQYDILSDQVQLLPLSYRQAIRQYFKEFVRGNQDRTT